MIMQRAQKEVEQAEQDAIKSAEYNLEQARTKATTRRAFSCQPCAGLLRMCTAFRTSSIVPPHPTFHASAPTNAARCSGLMTTSAQASARGRICMADRSAAGLGRPFVGAVSIGCHSDITCLF